jgi:hypothetical protein
MIFESALPPHPPVFLYVLQIKDLRIFAAYVLQIQGLRAKSISTVSLSGIGREGGVRFRDWLRELTARSKGSSKSAVQGSAEGVLMSIKLWY